MMTATDWAEMQPTIERCASSAYWRFKDNVEYDDLVQTAWLAYFEQRHELDKLWNSGGKGYVRLRIVAACNRMALREFRNRTGAQPEDQYRYTRGQLRALVRMVLGEPEGWEPGSDSAVAVIDVTEGLGQLPSEDWHALNTAYGPNAATPLSSATRTHAARAIKRLQLLMNPLTDR